MTKRVKNVMSRFIGIAGCLLLAVVGSMVMNHVNALAATGNWDGAKAAVIKAYEEYKTEVDVSDYNLNYATEYDELSSMMGDVVNETPYLFYAATSYTVSRNSSTNQIVKIGLGYTEEYKTESGTVRKTKIKNTRKKLDAAVNVALTKVDSHMSKIEKAMVLHDYLISTTTYTEDTSNAYRLSEIGALIKHKANCQGYSLAYGILLGKVGIPVQYVSSTEMSHMWNMIKIAGKWYHVDVTWDDPVDTNANKDQYGLVKHDNFMLSSTAFEKNGHYGFDTSQAVTKKYDSKYWKSVNSSFYYHNGKWLYMNRKGLVEKTSLTKGSKSMLYNVSGKTLVQFTDTKYYFIAYNRIYMYDYSQNSAGLVWKASSKYADGYTLTQIKYSKNYITYRVLNGTKYTTAKFKVNAKGAVA